MVATCNTHGNTHPNTAVLPKRVPSLLFAHNMADALECPVCLTLPEGEVHQCTEGHCYCLDCWLRLAPRRCPECRQPLPQANRNRAAERAIAALERHAVVAHECTADGPGLTGKWAAPLRSSFTITARGRGGQRLCSGGATFRVKVRGQGIVEAEVSDKLDGTYQVELTYPISGKYEVLVSLDRTKIPIKGSPFAVTVLPARPAPRYDVPPGWPPTDTPLPPPPLPPPSLVPPPLKGTATVERSCDCGAAQGAAPHAGSFDEVMARLELQVATTECEELRAQNQELRLQCNDLQQQVAVVCRDLQQVHRQLRLMAGRVWRKP
jgi:hypothetical protein